MSYTHNPYILTLQQQQQQLAMMQQHQLQQQQMAASQHAQGSVAQTMPDMRAKSPSQGPPSAPSGLSAVLDQTAKLFGSLSGGANQEDASHELRKLMNVIGVGTDTTPQAPTGEIHHLFIYFFCTSSSLSAFYTYPRIRPGQPLFPSFGPSAL